MKKTKQLVIGELPEDLYKEIMSGAAKQFKKQIKQNPQNKDITFDENQTDEDFVKAVLLGNVITGYKQHEAFIAAKEAQEKRKAEIDTLLKK